MWGAKPAKMVLRDCKGKQGAHVPFWKRSSFGLSSGIIWERAGCSGPDQSQETAVEQRGHQRAFVLPFQSDAVF